MKRLYIKPEFTSKAFEPTSFIMVSGEETTSQNGNDIPSGGGPSEGSGTVTDGDGFDIGAKGGLSDWDNL